MLPPWDRDMVMGTFRDAFSNWVTLVAQPSAIYEMEQISRIQCQKKRFTIHPYKGLGYKNHSEHEEKGPHCFSLLLIEWWKMKFTEFCSIVKGVSPVLIGGLFLKPIIFLIRLFFIESLCRPFSLRVCGDHRLKTTVLENVWLIICLHSQESGRHKVPWKNIQGCWQDQYCENCH